MHTLSHIKMHYRKIKKKQYHRSNRYVFLLHKIFKVVLLSSSRNCAWLTKSGWYHLSPLKHIRKKLRVFVAYLQFLTKWHYMFFTQIKWSRTWYNSVIRSVTSYTYIFRMFMRVTSLAKSSLVIIGDNFKRMYHSSSLACVYGQFQIFELALRCCDFQFKIWRWVIGY